MYYSQSMGQLDQHINGFFEKVKLQDLTKTAEK